MDLKRIRKIVGLIGLMSIFASTVSINANAEDSGETSVFMDFRNQKTTDIIYSLADLCGESVLID